MDLFANMPTGAAALFWGIVTFSLLVLLHEGGHFLAARFFKVRVHEFMIGLPSPALKWRSKRSGVSYGVTMLPLGGYVRISGMEPGAEDEKLGAALGMLVDAGRTDIRTLSESLGVDHDRASALIATLEDYGASEPSGDDRSATAAVVERAAGESDDELLSRVRSGTYRGLKTWQRITILAMGVIVNLVTAILIFTVVLSAFGVPTPTTTIEEVVKGGAAAAAGVRTGDTVVAIDGTAMKDWDHVRTTIADHKPGDAITLTVRRAGASVRIPVTLSASKTGTALLGVRVGLKDVTMPPLQALGESFKWTGMVFVAIAQFFSPKTFATSVSNARSVVGISYEVAAAAKEGALSYAWMIALLSLSLGAMNILPIPPLDGGKVALEIVEKFVRRPIDRRVSLGLSAVGTLLLFSLIFYLMYADIVRYIVKG